jgi:hypothetical protein
VRSQVGYFDQLLADVLAGEQGEEGAGGVLNAGDDGFAVFEFSFVDPLRHLAKALLEAVAELPYKEPFGASLFDDKLKETPHMLSFDQQSCPFPVACSTSMRKQYVVS